MKKAMRIFCRDLRRLIHSPAAMLVMAGVAILPSLYAWFNIAANMDPYGNTSNILMQILQQFRLPLPIMIRMPPPMTSQSMPVTRSWKI